LRSDPTFPWSIRWYPRKQYMNRLTFSIGLLFILVMLVSIPAWMENEKVVSKKETEDAWLPNYQATTMSSTLYGKDGKINHQVFASKMEHYELLGFTIFKQPQYTIFINAQQTWKVKASEGTLYEDNRIQFETDVEITSLNDQGFMQTIRTEFIEVNLTEKTMNSDQTVEIIGQNYVIKSNGLSADLKTQKYELTDHVQTIFQPSVLP
jgi:lipopolysaccharide export system protein LptC